MNLSSLPKLGIEMLVSSIMTPEPVSVGRHTRLDEALELMVQCNLRHLPVVEEGRLFGVVSDRDLLGCTGGLPARVHACRGPFRRDHARHIGDMVRAGAIQIDPADTVERAYAVLIDESIGCLPVVEAGALVGIVTDMDLLRTFVQHTREGALQTAESTVADHMTPSPISIHWYSSMGEALALCRTHSVRHLPVLEAGQILGLVSDRDLRRAMGAGRHEETPVDEMMTRRVVTVSPRSSLVEAAETMYRYTISALPVVDDEEEVVGIITVADVLVHCRTAYKDRG